MGGAETQSARGGSPVFASETDRRSQVKVHFHARIDLGKQVVMSTSVAAVADRRQDDWLVRWAGFRRCAHTGALALTFVILASALASTQPWPVRAGQEPEPGTKTQRGVPRAPSAFVVESRNALKELREALSGLAMRALARIEQDGAGEGDIASQRLMVESAKAQFEAAKGARELAQLALKEYQEIIIKTEQAALEAELKLVQDELKRATSKLDQAKERYAKIKAASNGSAYGLTLEWRFGIIAEIEELLDVREARLMIEQAHQLKVEQARSSLNLRGRSMAAHEAKLVADVEVARSGELAKKATWELEQSKLSKLHYRPNAAPRLTDHQKRMLAIVDTAIPIEEKLSKKLAECEKAADVDESLRKETTALAGRLAALVEEGRGEEAHAAMATLKQNVARSPSFGAAFSPLIQAGDEAPVASKNVVEPSGFVVESRKTLRKLKEEILTLAKQAMETADATGRSQANVGNLIINQDIATKSAEANYENAKLTREVAEIAIVEYQEGIFAQDELTADGELKLAESNLSRATDLIGLAKDRAAKIKDASDGSVYDLGIEFSYEDQIGESEQRESKARMAVQEARSKLELLRKFTKAKRVTELQIAVAKERATELARQAQWEREKLKLAKLQEEAKKQDSASLPAEGVRSLLKRALSIVEELKSKLDLAAKDREPSEAARTEITNLMAQLRAIVEQMPAARAADQWAALKPKVHAAALRYLKAKPTVEAK
jgi:hypothetical protein